MNFLPESLSVESIREAIRNVCVAASAKKIGFTFHIADFDSPKQSDLLFGFVTTITTTTVNEEQQQQQQQQQQYVTTFSIQYSTWEGRVLFLEKLGLDDDRTSIDVEVLLSLRQILSSIAIKCSCSRLTWAHYGDDIVFTGFPKSDTHEEVITLFWSSDAMLQYVGQDNPPTRTSIANDIVDYRDDIINKLNQQQSNAPKNVRLRLSTVDDLQTIQRLVQGLADFAQEPDGVKITTEHFKVDGYETTWPLFYCLLLDQITEENNEDTVNTFGIAFFYFGYTIEGEKYLYLEGFFIEELYRGNGCGKYVMHTLAIISLSLQCTRMVWLSLVWNHPALNFYKSIGATIQDGMLTSRLANDNLKSFAIFC